MEMALFSIRWIQEFLIVRWLENGKTLSMKDIEKISWRYAREVEHSDNNLNTLEDWLFENYYLIHSKFNLQRLKLQIGSSYLTEGVCFA